MSCVVGIISEYNPFHNGHKYQVEQIKQAFPDSTVIAIMSGNIVQRGEFAAFDKYTRTAVALENGVDAVFEMPYPYCGSTAEIFANAGVEIAHCLGCDYLCFGTEEHELEQLENIADIIDSDTFEAELKNQMEDKTKSFVSAKTEALEKFGADIPKSSNDMLALEYIRAIKCKKSPIKCKAIKRVGAGYKDESICDTMSASAIRRHYYENGELLSVPSKDLYLRAIDGENVLDIECANKLLHQHALLSLKISSVFDSNTEIEGIIKSFSRECSSGDFLEKLSSKIYTNSRLRRVLLYSLFNVKNVDLSPKYTFLLGTNSKGRELLNRVKKNQKIVVITKHSDIKKLTEESIENAEKRYEADAVYSTLLRCELKPSDSYKIKPIIK